MKELTDKLADGHALTEEEYLSLLTCNDHEAEHLRQAAQAVAQRVFGREVKARGLIEISSYCKNNCLYCGIRAGNPRAERYRLTKEEIMECCRQGDALGFQTFVLQGGEDAAGSMLGLTAIFFVMRLLTAPTTRSCIPRQ